jgi:DNA-binding response OmpR family regulator
MVYILDKRIGNNRKIGKYRNRVVMRNNVLIVDGGKKMVEKTRAFLLSNNFDVSCVHSGKECLDFLKEQSVDIILLDIILPDMLGEDLVKTIKSYEDLKEIAIVFVSVVSGDEDNEVEEAGIIVDGECYPILSKPLNLRYLLDLINIELAGYV